MSRNIINMLSSLDAYAWGLKYKIYTHFYGVPIRPMISQLIDKTDLIGVEIGVYHGDHVKSILKNCDIKKLYLVDPYKNYSKYTDAYGVEPSLNPVFALAKNNLIKYNNTVQFIRKYSSNAIDFIPNNLDFVYIDGNHQYEFIKQDIELYWHKIKPGGIIGGHDISNGSCDEHNGIITAVYEFAAEHNLQIKIQEPDWWFLKSE